MKMSIPISAAIALALGTAQFAYADTQLARGDTSTSQSQSSLPSFDQVNTSGSGRITPSEAAAAGLSIDWSKADQDGSGSLSRDEYSEAVKNGEVKAEHGGTTGGTTGNAPGGSSGGMGGSTGSGMAR